MAKADITLKFAGLDKLRQGIAKAAAAFHSLTHEQAKFALAYESMSPEVTQALNTFSPTLCEQIIALSVDTAENLKETDMIRRCCYCGAQGAPLVESNRWVCSSVSGCVDRRGGLVAHTSRETRDHEGKNGPETWVNISEMQCCFGYLQTQLDNLREQMVADSKLELKMSKEYYNRCFGKTLNGVTPATTFAGVPVFVDPHMSNHLMVIATPPKDLQRKGLIDTGKAMQETLGMAEVRHRDAFEKEILKGFERQLVSGPEKKENKETDPHVVVHVNGNLDALVDTIEAGMKEREGQGIDWEACDKILEDVPHVAGPQSTTTARFELKDGRRVGITEPSSEDWEKMPLPVAFGDWEPPRVALVHGGHTIETNDDQFIKVEHDEGRCWLADFGPILSGQHARLLSITHWQRKAPDRSLESMVECYYGGTVPRDGLIYDHCPSNNDPVVDWPEGRHPRKVIHGEGWK